MRETDIQRAIVKELEKQGAYVARVVKAGKSGTPDLICSYRGHFMGLEIKTAKGRPSELQLYHLEKIRKAGGTGEILRSVDELRKLLTRLGPTVE